MRIRVFGQYVHVSIAVLVALESVLLFSLFSASAFIRFPADLAVLEDRMQLLWPSGVLYAMVMALSLLSFGLYSSRQRAL